MMQSILQSASTTRPPIGNTYYRKNVSPNTTKTLVNPSSITRPDRRVIGDGSGTSSLFRESMFVRVIPTRPCASCNGAR